MLAKKPHPEEIVIELTVDLSRAGAGAAKICSLQRILTVPSSMRPIELEQLIQEMVLGLLELSELSEEFISGELLFLNTNEPTLKSCGIKNGSRISYVLNTYRKREGSFETQKNYIVSSVKNHSAAVGPLNWSPLSKIFPCLKLKQPCLALTSRESFDGDKWATPSEGLNFIGTCDNSECHLHQHGILTLMPWKSETFDLSSDRKSVTCPMCSGVFSIQSPVFHMTQWRYYGQKRVTAQALHGGTNLDPVQTGDSDYMGCVAEQSSELVGCDWQVADAGNENSGLALETAEIKLEEWHKLVLLTRPLQKFKRRPTLEQYKVGLSVSVPLVCTVSFNFDMFRDYIN